MSETVFGPGEAINEKTSAKYSCVLTDQSGTPIGSGVVSTLKATLQTDDGTIINSRSAQSVLNTNGGTLDSSGNFALTLSAADTVVSGAAKLQRRLLTLDVVFSSGTLTHTVTFYINALAAIS